MASELVELEEGCAKLDKALALYYESTGKLDQYYGGKNHNVDSIFAIWVDDNGFDDDTLEDELNDDPNEASMNEFHMDDNDNIIFPLRTNVNDVNQKKQEIFDIIKYCFKNGYPPPTDNLSIEQLNFDVDVNETKQTQKIFETQIPGITATVSKEPDVMYFFSTSKSNNGFPVLPTIVDCFARDRIRAKMNDDATLTAEQWVSKNMKNNPKLKVMINAINGYCKRICPLFQLSPVTAIDDSAADIANYIAAVSQFIKNSITNKTAQPPFQVDLSIAIKNVEEISMIETLDDGDADDDDDGVNPDISSLPKQTIGDIHGNLKHENCHYVDKPLNKIDNLKDRVLSKHFDEFKKKLKKENVDGYDNKTYPRKKRFVIFVDRRDNKKKQKDIVTFFDPPSVCNTMPKNHIPLWYIESIRKCIVPRKGFGDGSHEPENQAGDEEKKNMDDITISAQTAAGGHLITFSFHVEELNKVKCYLFWNQQSMRFYPQDIVEAFTFVFTKAQINKFRNDKKKVNDIMSRIHIKDEQYEGFYRSVYEKHGNKCNFPKNK